MERKLFVGNLPYQVGEQELQELFTQAGRVEGVQVVRDRLTGQSRGFAFVEMGTEEEAEGAIARFKDYSLGGRRMIVNEARPQAPRRDFAPRGGERRSRGSGRGGGRREPRW